MFYNRLLDRECNRNPVSVGIIGAGTFGTQIISQLCHTKGMRPSVVVDIELEKARHALTIGTIARDRVVTAKTSEDIDNVIDQDRFAATSNAEILMGSKVDIVVEVTGNVQIAAKYAHSAIMAKKHVVMVTVEADVLVGHLLSRLAKNAGVVYSAAYGDEPSLAFELWDWAKTLGFRVIAAGKGTRFTPSFRKANPDDVPRLYGYSGKGYNAQIFCSFLDGTKTAIEMAALSNMTGLIPDVRGMHFPTLELEDIPEKLALKSTGGILEREGVVEAVSAIHPDLSYVKRSLRGGMYAVIEGESAFQVESLRSYGDILGMVIGKTSKQALIYRPQHFVGHEVPIGIARIALDGQPSGTPIGRFSECVAAAKKTLKPGTILDGEGGYTTYGLIERADVAKLEKLVPMGLTQGAEVIKEIPADGPITYDNVKVADSFALRLRQLQDSLD